MATSRTNRGPPASESDPLLGRDSPTSYDAAEQVQRKRRRSSGGMNNRRRGDGGPSLLIMLCTYCSCSSCLFLIWIGLYATWNSKTGAWFQRGWTAHETVVVQQNSFTAAGLFLIYFFAVLYFWKRNKDDWVLDRYEMEMGSSSSNRRDE